MGAHMGAQNPEMGAHPIHLATPGHSAHPQGVPPSNNAVLQAKGTGRSRKGKGLDFFTPPLVAAQCLPLIVVVGHLHLTPPGHPAQQSGHADRITRTGARPGGPNREGGRVSTVHHSPFTLFPLHTLAHSRGLNDPHRSKARRTQQGGGRVYHPPGAARQLARQRRRIHPHQARPGSTFRRASFRLPFFFSGDSGDKPENRS